MNENSKWMDLKSDPWCDFFNVVLLFSNIMLSQTTLLQEGMIYQCHINNTVHYWIGEVQLVPIIAWSFTTWWCLTHWERVIHLRVVNLTIIGTDNGLLPDQHQAITWTNAEILLIGPLGTNFSEVLIKIHIHFHSRKCMMASSHGSIFQVSELLCKEFTGNQWIFLTKPSDMEVWCFLWCATE